MNKWNHKGRLYKVRRTVGQEENSGYHKHFKLANREGERICCGT